MKKKIKVYVVLMREPMDQDGFPDSPEDIQVMYYEDCFGNRESAEVAAAVATAEINDPMYLGIFGDFKLAYHVREVEIEVEIDG